MLFSETSKQMVMLELTVPWEERMEEASGGKKERYAELMEDFQRQGWRARCYVKSTAPWASLEHAKGKPSAEPQSCREGLKMAVDY